MRESTSSGSVLERYEVPAMRVVPTDGGRIVVGSPVSFIGDTGSLGVFDNGSYGWNDGSVGGNLGVFTGDDSYGWNSGSVDGGLTGFDGEGLGWASVGGNLGVFTGDDNTFWDEASATGGSLGGFDGEGFDPSWNAPSNTDGGLVGFGNSEGLGWASAGGGLGAFEPSAGQEWNGGETSNGGIDGFGTGTLQWSDSPSP